MQTPSPAFIVSCVALMLSLGAAAKAANTVFSTDISDGEVKTADLGDLSVTNPKLADNAVKSRNVFKNSITLGDLKGADVMGSISLPVGFVANGRCRDVVVSAAGAVVGEVPVAVIQGAAPEGILIQAVRASANNQVTLKVCNFTGGTMSAFDGLSLRIATFG